MAFDSSSRVRCGRRSAHHAEPARQAQRVQPGDARAAARGARARGERRRRSAPCCSPARAAASAPARISSERDVEPGAPPIDLSVSLGRVLQPAGAAHARAAQAHRLRGERRRGRRRRQHRARLRHRARRALGDASCRPSRSSAWCPTPAAPISCRASSARRAPWGSRCWREADGRGGRAHGV